MIPAALAMLLFALWWRLAGRGLAPLKALSRRQVLGLAAAGAVGVFGYTAFFMLGLQQVPASRAALIVTVNPVFTTLIAAWLFREKLTKAGAIKGLFERFDVELRAAGFIAMSGQIIDASLVAAPKQRNTDDENALRKAFGRSAASRQMEPRPGGRLACSRSAAPPRLERKMAWACTL
jgi:hypothetical protein